MPNGSRGLGWTKEVTAGIDLTAARDRWMWSKKVTLPAPPLDRELLQAFARFHRPQDHPVIARTVVLARVLIPISMGRFFSGEAAGVGRQDSAGPAVWTSAVYAAAWPWSGVPAETRVTSTPGRIQIRVEQHDSAKRPPLSRDVLDTLCDGQREGSNPLHYGSGRRRDGIPIGHDAATCSSCARN